MQTTLDRFTFTARMEEERAPRTCAWFRNLLPYAQTPIHARRSGESCWIPLGEGNPGFGLENAASHPALGEIPLYPGGYSETEVLSPCGATCCACKLGQLAGNHFLTVTHGREFLPDMGRHVLWHGVQNIVPEGIT